MRRGRGREPKVSVPGSDMSASPVCSLPFRPGRDVRVLRDYSDGLLAALGPIRKMDGDKK